MPFEILGCSIDLVDGAQCKCKRKQWFLFYTFLWPFQVTDYLQISRVGNCLPRTFRGHWRGVRRWGNFQLGRCTNQRRGAKLWTHQKYFLAQYFVDFSELFPDNTVFTIRKLALRTNGIKYRDLLTNQIVLYTCLTYVEPYQNILKHFFTKMKLWWLVQQTNQITVYATLWSDFSSVQYTLVWNLLHRLGPSTDTMWLWGPLRFTESNYLHLPSYQVHLNIHLHCYLHLYSLRPCLSLTCPIWTVWSDRLILCKFITGRT